LGGFRAAPAAEFAAYPGASIDERLCQGNNSTENSQFVLSASVLVVDEPAMDRKGEVQRFWSTRPDW